VKLTSWEDLESPEDWQRSAYEQYNDELALEQRAYWESVGAHGGVIE